MLQFRRSHAKQYMWELRRCCAFFYWKAQHLKARETDLTVWRTVNIGDLSKGNKLTSFSDKILNIFTLQWYSPKPNFYHHQMTSIAAAKLLFALHTRLNFQTSCWLYMYVFALCNTVFGEGRVDTKRVRTQVKNQNRPQLLEWVNGPCKLKVVVDNNSF